MAGFEASAVVDHDGGDDRYHNPHTQESAVVGFGMTGPTSLDLPHETQCRFWRFLDFLMVC
jgi:hypothetical protein